MVSLGWVWAVGRGHAGCATRVPCLRPAVGELCPVLRLPALSHPGTVFWLPWPRGTAVRDSPGAGTPWPSCAGWGGPIFESASHSTACALDPWGEMPSLESCGKPSSKMACGLPGVSSDPPKISQAFFNLRHQPNENEVFLCRHWHPPKWLYMRQYYSSATPLLCPLQSGRCSPPASTELPARWVMHTGQGQMEKGKGIMAFMTVTQGLNCETTA